MSDKAKFCIYSKSFNNYVLNLTFNDCGVLVGFTTDASKAARVSKREAANGLAKCVPGGVVRIAEPTALDKRKAGSP